jgi:hypothetical protein
MTVAELENRLSFRELIEWAAYYRIEPWGEERADLRSGVVAATVANANRGKKQKPFTPTDFMPLAEKRPEPAMNVDQKIRAAFRKVAEHDGKNR